MPPVSFGMRGLCGAFFLVVKWREWCDGSSGGSPHVFGHSDNQAPVLLLIVDRDRVAYVVARKSALWAQAELIKRGIFAGLVDPLLQLISGFKLGRLGRHQTEHHGLIGRDITQGRERAGAR